MSSEHWIPIATVMFWFCFYNWNVCISKIGRGPYLRLHQRHVLVKTIPSCVSLFVLYPILRKSHSGAKSAFDDPRSKALERFLNPCNRPLPREYELLYCMYCAALEICVVVAFCLWYGLIKKAENHTNVFFNPSSDFLIHVIAHRRGNTSCCTVLHLKFIFFVVAFFHSYDPIE